jgi:hypothetical protein
MAAVETMKKVTSSAVHVRCGDHSPYILWYSNARVPVDKSVTNGCVEEVYSGGDRNAGWVGAKLEERNVLQGWMLTGY